SLMSDLTTYVGLYQTVLAFAAMSLAGRVVCRGRWGIAVQCLAGWGALCVLLTLWGVATATSLRVPAAAFLLLSLAGLFVGRAEWRDDLTEVGRMAAIAAPCLWVMADIAPSQVDLLAVILPNAGYLYDHATFPSLAGAPSFSELPVATYNTEFVSFLGSLFGGGFAANTPSLFTVLLHVIAGLLFARVLAGDQRPGWRLTALGLALATIIDPGFAPRVSFSGYGESPLAITLLFAGWLGAAAMGRLAAGERWPGVLVPLALVLCAMVNAKQQAVGLFLATVGGLFVVAALDKRIGWRASLRATAIAAVPAACLYVAWAAYVHAEFPQGQLAPRSISQWPWAMLPQILVDMGKVLLQKGYYAAAVIAMAALALYRRRFASPARELSRIAVAVFVLYTGFLVAIYLGWFDGEHSYFRYNTQLSALITLALALAARDWLASERCLNIAGSVLLAVLMIGPLAWPRPLRFDRTMPQPWLQAAARHLAEAVDDHARVAVMLPGDNSSIRRALSAFVRYDRPRRPDLDLRPTDPADPADLAKAAAEGYRLAFLSCTDSWAPRLPPHAAALLTWSDGQWKPLHVWPYPPAPADRKDGWSYQLAGAPLCL
ncbi:MAG: hypothetical protein JO128_01985, partial [Alphaproteobacteria bacterium]|nr:hypothetical protein [Alphaproteobacteria bacterium]